MHDSIIGKVVEKVNGSQTSAVDFNQIDSVDSSKRIAFIDGGNLEIIKAADFAVYALRVCCTIYKNNKRIALKGYNFQAFVSENDVHIVDEDNFSAGNIAQLNDIDEIRRLLEIKLANKMADETDIIVLDGCLDHLDISLFDDVRDRVVITALSKTTEHSMIAEINKSMPSALGFACFGADYFLRLHEKSNYVFRFNVLQQLAEQELYEILSLLAANSKDPVFLGYPYGLVEADRFARVSKKEAESLRFRIMAKLGKQWESVKKHEASLDAHSVLDSIFA